MFTHQGRTDAFPIFLPVLAFTYVFNLDDHMTEPVAQAFAMSAIRLHTACIKGESGFSAHPGIRVC
jgi:hypothetical protein